jgi:4'-phosphopantetheinyl transferase EntD
MKQACDGFCSSRAARGFDKVRFHGQAIPIGAPVRIEIDRSLQSAIEALPVPGVMIGHRLILPGDEHALLPEELCGLSSSVVERRRASGAARTLARELLERLGYDKRPVPRAASGAPVWPPGVVGSLAHDQQIAVAAVAMERKIAALGIDVEPAEELPPDLLDLVATPPELQRLDDDPYRGRLLFSAKEAVYKALHPLDGTFLDHHDVQIDFSRRKGIVRTGRTVELRFCVSTHLIAVAFIHASP